MMNAWRPAAYGLISRSYWSPSAGNLLSCVVLAIGADMRLRADAIEVLRLISNSSIDDIAHIVGDAGGYRAMETEAFASIRAGAIAIIMSCMNARVAKGGVDRDMRRIADRRVDLHGAGVIRDARHVVDRRVQVSR